MRARLLASGLLGMSLLVAGPAWAETIAYMAKLDGASETPPNTTAGTGMVKATYDSTSKKLDWTIDYKGLTGDATMAHFHGPAPVGKAAGPMVTIEGPLASPIKGSATLTDAQAKALTDGQLYFNIHTAANKNGEIRGQLEKSM